MRIAQNRRSRGAAMKPIVVPVTLLLLLTTQTDFAQTANNARLVDMVTRMAKIGRATSPTFSPRGARLAFVSDWTGVPQAWVTAVDGSAPQQVTKGDDPVGRVIWSPDGEWLGLSLAPGGGVNTQFF